MLDVPVAQVSIRTQCEIFGFLLAGNLEILRQQGAQLWVVLPRIGEEGFARPLEFGESF